MAAVRSKWIWGISGKYKYAVKDLTEIEIVENPVKQTVQVAGVKRVGWQKVLLKEYDARVSIPAAKVEARKFINETFPSR